MKNTLAVLFTATILAFGTAGTAFATPTSTDSEQSGVTESETTTEAVSRRDRRGQPLLLEQRRASRGSERGNPRGNPRSAAR